MKLLRHPIAALVIFAILVSLCVTIYAGLQESYDVVETGTQVIAPGELNLTNTTHYNYNENATSVMGALSGLTIIESINDLQTKIERIAAPTNLADLVGALMGSGLGIVKLIWGVFTFPIEIMNIILKFYYVPPIIIGGINVMIFIYLAFIVLSLYVKGEI